MRSLWLSLMIVCAAASGCVAPDAAGPVDAASNERRPSPAPAQEAGSDPAARTEEPARAPAEETSAAYEASAPVLSTLALAFEGTTQTFVCIPTALPACGVALGGGTERYVPEFEGAPRSARVTLTWSAQTPLTETLVLHVEGVEGCHEECHVMGPSPLELVLDDITLAEEWELTIHAFVPCQVCDGHDKMVDPGQEFSISGELTYAPYG